ncbi:MAG: arginine--tRNA ligase [Coprobacillus sp.]|nr:arginine--tRNA ligase [Coprobacillus sp.]
MDVQDSLKKSIIDALKIEGLSLTLEDIVIEVSKDKSFGDYSTNTAMKYAKKVGKSPIELANSLISNFHNENVSKLEVAGPGFINFFLKSDSILDVVPTILEQDTDYGRGETKNKKVNIEFVSANPTGDLHVGHARGAAVGDSLARILSFDGYDVTKEYYINDAGNQIDNLALSLIGRYRELLGLDFTLPEDGYHGEDIIEIAKDLKNEYGDKLLEREDCMSFFKKEGIKRELDKINEVLDSYDVHFDVYTSELDIRKDHAVEKEIEYLKPHCYIDEGATYLKTTDYLDDKDRVIVKSDGAYTYFLPDIVYHLNKLSRGYDLLIDVLGSDHHGYISRLKSALMIHGYSKDILEVSMIQMVRFMKDGQEVKASKRTGNAITMKELIDEVGKDAARYYFTMRSGSVHFDFDLDQAVRQNASNPVYYAEYAHARATSVLNLAKEKGLEPDNTGLYLKEDIELSLLKTLSLFPKVVKDASKDRAPYKITNYIQDVSEEVHQFYTKCKIIDLDNVNVSKSRLSLVKCAKIVLRNAFNLIGVTPMDKM